MDDICDPVDEVERACQRTKDIDKILATVGFNVIELISNKAQKENNRYEEHKISMFHGNAEEMVLGIK